MSRWAGLSLVLACVALGCIKMKVVIKDYDGPYYDPSPEECRVRFFRSLGDPNEICEFIALVRVRDTGVSTRCGSGRVQVEVLKAACRIGGNAAILARKDSFFSTCAQADAAVYDCRPVEPERIEAPQLITPAPLEPAPIDTESEVESEEPELELEPEAEAAATAEPLPRSL